MSAIAEAPTTAAAPPLRWIVSPRWDLGFFVLTGGLTFAFWGLYEALKGVGLEPSGLAALLTYFVFSACLDLPHVYQTFARTHADDVEFARRRRVYVYGLPALCAAGLAIPWFGLDAWFIAFMAMYGSHHVVRQHVGFMKIYQGLNDGPAPVDRLLDRAALELGLYACVLHDYVQERGNLLRDVPVYGPWHATFPGLPPTWVHGVELAAWVALGLFAARQAWLMAEGQRLNWPKLALMGMALLTHYTVFVIAAVPFLVAEALETAYHDGQYHGWSMAYQQRRFPGVPRVALKWLGAALLYGLIAGSIEAVGYGNDLCYWLFAPLGMITLFHYWIDGKIWRLGANPELREVMFGNAPPSKEDFANAA
jgi:hypothetical protein